MRSSLAIHPVTHESNCHPLASQCQSAESGLCFMGKTAPHRHMCSCLSAPVTSQEASAKPSLVPGPGMDADETQQGATCSGLGVLESPGGDTGAGKCPRAKGRGATRGFWEETWGQPPPGGEHETCLRSSRACGGMQAPPHIRSRAGCTLQKQCLQVGHILPVQITFCKKIKCLTLSSPFPQPSPPRTVGTQPPAC